MLKTNLEIILKVSTVINHNLFFRHVPSSLTLADVAFYALLPLINVVC